MQQNLRSLPRELVQRYADCTVHLDFSHNTLKDLAWLADFEQLRYLVLDSNRLHESQLRTLNAPLPQLEVLMLNKNEVSLGYRYAFNNVINSPFPSLTVQRSGNYSKTYQATISQSAVFEPAR